MRVKNQSGAPTQCSECERETIYIELSESREMITVVCKVCGEQEKFGVLRGRKTVIES